MKTYEEKCGNIVFENDLISLVWEYTRLDVLDSDNNYIEYYFDSCFYDEKEQEEMIQTFINDVQHLNEKDLCNYLKDIFDSILKIEPFCGDEKTMQELREIWGDEYVVRIGNTALIIKE